MVTKEDLIGKWTIIENVLKDTSDGKQEEIDKINDKYTLEFKKDGTYKESNSGIILRRLANFTGKYILDDNELKLTFKTFKHGRTYKILSFDENKGIIKLRPCDSLFCKIYTNIDYLVINLESGEK